MVATICIFIRQKFKQGLRHITCIEDEVQMGEIFRTDAKCEDGRVVLGGWSLLAGSDTRVAPWFAIEIFPEQAPWLFKGDKNESSWASTSAELLASLVALKLFGSEVSKPSSSRSVILKCGGGTDNKATGQLVSRRLSTKWPVMIVLMDFL